MSDFYNKYPYTDFHELNLDWVIERVKKLTEDWLATHEEWVGVQQDWADTEQAWIDFKAYVENYLANLDVQDEIDHKIDQMVADGSLRTLIKPDVESQTIVTTTDWLAAHITQPTTPAIDTSLSITGAAADAAVTGNMINGLRSFSEDSINRVQLDEITLHQGGIDGTTGIPNTTLGTRVYTSPLSYRDFLEVNAGYQILYVYKYDKNGFVSYSGSGQTTFTPPDPDAYYRLVLADSDTTASILPTDSIIKTTFIADTHDKLLADIINKNNETDNRISGVGYRLYQGTLDTVKGLPIYNANRLYTMPIYYGDTLSLKSGFTIAYVYRFENDVLVQYVPIGSQSWTPLADLSGSYYRAIISKSDNTQPILPTEDIIDSFVIGSSYHKQPTIKMLNDDYRELKGFDYQIKEFRVEAGGYNRIDGSTSFLINVKDGEVITFEPGTNNSYFLMVDSYTDAQSTPDYSTGYSSYGVLVTDYVSAVVPAGAQYLIVLKNVGGNSDRTPAAIMINGFDIFRSMIENWNDDPEEYDTPIDLLAANTGYEPNELKWLAIGDSYTEINDTVDPTIRSFIKKGYMDRVCEKLPMLECTNIGHSGWTFVTWESSLSQITAGYDLYTIMLGTNDWSLSANWGTITDFTNRTSGTSLGAFGKIIDKIKSVEPNAKIIVMTQFHRTVAIVPSGTVIEARNHDTYLPNNNGLYFADMEQDIIECCESEDIEYLDIFTLSRVTPLNAMKTAKVNTGGGYQYLRYPDYLQYIVYGETVTNPYDSTTYWAEYDGCHPSWIGMKIIADLLTEKIKDVMFR